MRLGVVWEDVQNANYRALFPMQAMERRGHTVVWPPDMNGKANARRLAGCDVVHVYRSVEAHSVLADLVRAGVPMTYDNDDDFMSVPKQSPSYRELGGTKGHVAFAQSVKMARMASVCTTTNDLLAQKYRQADVARVEVIGNYLSPTLDRPRNRHDGVVIGWVAALDHRADAAQIKIAEALERLVQRHPQVRVQCIGVDLALPERYRHDAWVPYHELPGRIAGFDIAIAPLADIPFNHARSDIKLKEYAASGVPWLASPVGPYLGLGEDQGGRLVPDDGWFEALEQLVTSGRQRRRLARKARKWAAGEMVDAVADRWEQVFAEAAG
jgi:glycosyltransferase involved in cell wall biosynthesis